MGEPQLGDPGGAAPGGAPGSGPTPRHNPRWPAAPPWHETREEFEARVAEYDRREAVLARHNIHVVYREANDGFQLRTDGRPGVWAADKRTAYLCDARDVPVTFGQASHTIEYAWEHLVPPDAKAPEDRVARSDGQGAGAPCDARRHGVAPGG